MIAVIISQYRHEHLLPDAIQSVLNQTYKDWKMFIYNDDPKINLNVYDYCDDRITVFHDCVDYLGNMGQAARFNQGLQHAWDQGYDYICFLGADDMMMPWRLKVMMRAFEVYKDAEILYSDFIQINSDNHKQYIKARPFDIDVLKQKNYIAAGTVFLKVSNGKIPLFDEDLRYGEDWFWYHKLYLAGYKFQYVPTATLWYRIGYSVVGIDPVRRDILRDRIMGMY